MRVPLSLTLLAVLACAPCALSGQKSAPARLVVQQNGQALVTEPRQVELNSGECALPLDNLPDTLDPQSLQVRSRTSPGKLRVLDLTLDEETLTPGALLRRHLGKKVRLVLPDGKSRDGRIEKEAVLLSAEEAPLFLVDGQIYSGPVDAILYPAAQEELSPRPRHTLHALNSGPASQTLELTYVAREISWRMDYVLTLDTAGTHGLLSGWASVTNRSGKDYGPSQVELLAGEPRTLRAGGDRSVMALAAPMAKAAFMESATESESFEQHLYRLPRPLELANRQTRQAALFAPASIAVTRRLVGRANALPDGGDPAPRRQDLDVVLSYRNTETQGLGLPLPKGALRAYQEEAGLLRPIGETMTDRAPVGAMVELKLGQAFDLRVERVATQYEKTGKNACRAAWELRLFNGKKTPQKVVLHERMPGKWQVEQATSKWSKSAAGELTFEVEVPPTREGEPHIVSYSYSAQW